MPTVLKAVAGISLGLTSLVAGSSSLASRAGEASIESNVKLPPGYLDRAALPDSLALLPPPPEPGSASFARDEEARMRSGSYKDTPRWTLAASDADLHFPHAAGAFACAAGLPISQEQTPWLYGLANRMLTDVALSVYRAKDHYKRTRPFVVHQKGTCTPGDEALLRTDGSYPSGHSAVGWGWALVLAELVPARADAIIKRGLEFGQSRVVCNVHWQSDVDAGRLMASAAVARLHADATFAADLAAAKAEVVKVAQVANAPAQCASESAALAASR